MKSRLHVVQTAAFPFPTRQGSQVYVGGMASALARRGHRVTLVCYGFGEGEWDPLIDVRGVSVPADYRNLRAGPDWVKPLLDVRLTRFLCQLAPEADLIHAHNYEAPLAAYVARRLHGTPVVYNNHNTMSEELHQYFESPLLRGLARAVGWGLDRSIPRRADASVAISQTAEPVLRKLGCREVHHIPPGVDLADFQGGDRGSARAELNLGSRVWVVYAGNPDAYQDLDVLVDAVAKDDELGLLMITAADWSAIEEQAAAIPASRRRFVRADSWERTRHLLRAGDIAALPRSVCSGYPIKLLNYLGLGLPVVCAEGSAQPSEGTVVVPNRDSQALHEALRRLASHEEERTRLGEAGRDWVETCCSWNARAEELEQLYEKIMTMRSDRRPRSLA